MLRIFLPFVLFLCVSATQAQEPPPAQADEPAPIADNSFLIEEAYNQETGVVQHVGTFVRSRTGDFEFTFTKEFPLFSQRHQLSYTLPAFRASDPQGGRGVGDLLLNYRYSQWFAEYRAAN